MRNVFRLRCYLTVVLLIVVVAPVVSLFVMLQIVRDGFIGLVRIRCVSIIKEIKMAKRHQLSNGYSQSMFTRHAMRVHPLNSGVLTGPGGPMRGGIRL